MAYPYDAGGTPKQRDANSGNNESNPLAFINPHDIQSIEVLKDSVGYGYLWFTWCERCCIDYD